MIDWILGNLDTIKYGLGLLGLVVSFVVGLTPSPKDDNVWGAIMRFLGRFGVTTHADEPGTLKPPGKTAAPLFYRDKS